MMTGEPGAARTLGVAAPQDIVCISSIDFDFIWQGHQQIMSTLAAQGNRVLFIENTGIRSVSLSDMPRLKKRLARWWHSVRGFRQERPNLYVYSPLGLPFPYSRIAQWINRFLITLDLGRWMKAVQFNKPVVWTFLPTPLAMDLIRSLDPKLVIYYCIDNFAASSPSAKKILRAEEKMFERADMVFVTSHQLEQYACRHNSNVHLFPFGVDYDIFERARNSDIRSLPEDMAGIPAPRIGYVGGIHKWVNLDLLKETASRNGAYQFVLVGPIQTDVSLLRGLPNVHFLGPKPHDLLPDYIRSFDVCTIPYRLTEYTDNVYPTKTNEYLAMGKPVVSTPLKEISLFNQRHGPLISIASNPGEFAQGIEKALGSGEEKISRRIEVARENSWQVKIGRMAALIETTIKERAANKALKWPDLFLGLYRNAQRKIITSLAAAGLFAGLLFFSPLPWFIAAPLKLSDALRKADAIVVLAGGVGESGKAGQGYEERVNRAVELYKSGYADKLIFSSGYVYVFQEPEVMKALAVSLGIPPEAILLETKAVNTRQNALYTAKILKENGWKRILLVSSPYHMRRALLSFAKTAPELEVVAAPVEESYYYSRRRPGMTLSQIEGIAHEYMAILYYRLKGWV